MNWSIASLPAKMSVLPRIHTFVSKSPRLNLWTNSRHAIIASWSAPWISAPPAPDEQPLHALSGGEYQRLRACDIDWAQVRKDCGWVQVSKNKYPNVDTPKSAVAVGKTEEYKVVHVNDRWWIIYSGELIGYFMDNFWNGSFTNIKTVAWYGEVASGREKPCIDMGNGKFGGKPGAAVIEDIRGFTA
jgi:hypothetical protein